jgi:hypothetical protein
MQYDLSVKFAGHYKRAPMLAALAARQVKNLPVSNKTTELFLLLQSRAKIRQQMGICLIVRKRNTFTLI